MDRHIPLLKDEEIRPDVLEMIRERPPISVYRLLGHVPEIAGPWMQLISGIYKTDLDPRLREIALCRIGHLTSSRYEFHQHRLIGLAAGLSDRDMEAITIETPVTSLDADGNLVCQAADELEEKARLTDETYDALIARFGTSGTVALIATTGTYCMVARITNGTRLQLEATDPLANVKSPL